MLDVFVGGTDEDCLRFLERWPFTETKSWAHYEHFIIAEADGAPVGALCGYLADDVNPLFGKPAVEVAVQRGWSHDDLVAAWHRISAARMVQIERAPGAWVVECVAVVPSFRRRGVNTDMLQAVLDRGREAGATVAEISVLIGNEPAQRSYEKAGFVLVGEARNEEYEAAFGCPGVRLLRRPI